MTTLAFFDSFDLRDYQISLIGQALEAFQQGHKHVLLQSATGSGKTKTAATIIKQYFDKGSKILVLCHREELLSQIQAEMIALFGIPVGIIKAGIKPTPSAQIQVASVQSLCKRDLSQYSFDFIWTDEAHHAVATSYKTIYAALPNALHLGVTATPERLDGKGLDEIFDVLFCGPQIASLIDQGHLSKFRYFVGRQIGTKGLKVRMGDFAQGELAERSKVIIKDIVPEWLKFAEGKKTVVFCVDIAHTKLLLKEFISYGIPAAALSSKTHRDERKKIMEDFKSGKILVLLNCSLIDEGIDLPGIEAIQIVRPTASIVKHLQQIGRALRPLEGKTSLILDHTSNWQRLGLPDAFRTWKLEGNSEWANRSPIGLNGNGEIVDRDQADEPIYSEVELQEIKISENKIFWMPQFHAILQTQQRRQHKPGWIVYRLKELASQGLPADLDKGILSILKEKKLSPTWAKKMIQEGREEYELEIWRNTKAN